MWVIYNYAIRNKNEIQRENPMDGLDKSSAVE